MVEAAENFVDLDSSYLRRDGGRGWSGGWGAGAQELVVEVSDPTLPYDRVN